MGEESSPLVPLSVPVGIPIPTGSLIDLPSANAVVWLDSENWQPMRGTCGSRQVLTVPESDSRVIVLKTKYRHTWLLKTDWCTRGLLPLPVDGSFLNAQVIGSHPIAGFISPQESEELLQYARSVIEPIIKKVRMNVGALSVLDFSTDTSVCKSDSHSGSGPDATGLLPCIHHHNRCRSE